MLKGKMTKRVFALALAFVTVFSSLNFSTDSVLAAESSAIGIQVLSDGALKTLEIGEMTKAYGYVSEESELQIAEIANDNGVSEKEVEAILDEANGGASIESIEDEMGKVIPGETADGDDKKTDGSDNSKKDVPDEAESPEVEAEVEAESASSEAALDKIETLATFSSGRLLVGLNSSVDAQGALAATPIVGEGFVVLQYASADAAAAAYAYYKGNSAIDYVEVDKKAQATEGVTSVADEVGIYATYNSWGYGAFTTGYSGNYGLNLDKFLSAYKSSFTGTIYVAVLDTGIEDTNSMFNGRVGTCKNFTDESSYIDGHGHGTHCAGTIVEATPSRVKIMAGKVLDNSGSGWDSEICEGIYWAADSGADVISMSLGGYGSSSSEDAAITYANGKKVITVVAAGNDSEDASYYSPSNCPYTITVGATGDWDENDGYAFKKGNLAYYSNWGDTLDIIAPGSDILSAEPYSNSLVSKSGTSMATPHVAAICALFKCVNKSITYSSARTYLRDSGKNNGYSSSDRNLTYEAWTRDYYGNKLSYYGDYTIPRLILGSKTLKGVSTPEKVSESNVLLSATEYTYNGSTKKPTVTAYNKKGKQIASKYYTVKYSNNKAMGTATVTVKFKGNYSGTVKKYFKIVPKKVSGLSLQNLSGGIKVKWSKVSGVTGYEVYRSANGGSYKKVANVKAGSSSPYFKDTNVKSGVKYKYKVRAYKSYYGKFSSTKSITRRKPSSMDTEADVDDKKN